MSLAARALLIVLLASAATVAVRAQGRPPEGIELGPIVLTPSLHSSVEANDNLFLRAASTNNVASETVTTLTMNLGAEMPVRNSRLRLELEAQQYNYQTEVTNNSRTYDATIEFRFNFGTSDRLVVRERATKEIQQLETFVGEENKFTGEAYFINAWDVELSRSVRRRQGYSIRVRRVDLNYEDRFALEDSNPDRLESASYDYRGFDTAFEYRQPLVGGKWFILYYGTRRYNHYQRFGEVGVPFRRELSEDYQVGFRGFLGENRPFYLRFGMGDFRYDPRGEGQSEKRRSISGAANASFPLNEGSKLEVSLSRRSLPSNTDTYYILNDVRVAYRKDMTRTTSMGLDARYAITSYGETELFVGCENDARRDTRRAGEIFVEWLLHERFGLRLSADNLRRDSTCRGQPEQARVPPIDGRYSANRVFLSFNLGWF